MRLFVPLSRAETEALMALARAERRRPQDQAALLLSAAIAASLQGHASGPSDGEAPSASRGLTVHEFTEREV